MKKHLVLVLAVCLSFPSFSQEENDKSNKGLENSMALFMQPKIIELEVDEKVLTKVQENTYMNADQTVRLVAMQMLASIERMKIDMSKEDLRDGQELIDKGSFKNKGKEILFVYYKMTQGDKTVMVDMYCKEHDKGSTITITSFYPIGEDSKYKGLIKKAAISAHLKSN